MTSQALFFYSFGLFAYGTTRVVNCAFFAIKDTRTPTKVAGLALCLNIAFNSLLIFPLKLGGLALATSCSGIISCFVLLALLVKKIGSLELAGVARFSVKVCAASAAMGLVCHLVASFVPFSTGLAGRAMSVIAPLSAGIAAYAVFASLLRIEEMRKVWALAAVNTPKPAVVSNE